MIKAMTPPAITRGGILESRTNARSQPFMKPIAKPPKNVASSCMNFPTWHDVFLKYQQQHIRAQTKNIHV
jgi:hypothetical protein